jgi:hypothetical protein
MDVIAACGLCPRLRLLGTPAFGCVRGLLGLALGHLCPPSTGARDFTIRPASRLPKSLGPPVTIGQGRPHRWLRLHRRNLFLPGDCVPGRRGDRQHRAGRLFRNSDAPSCLGLFR